MVESNKEKVAAALLAQVSPAEGNVDAALVAAPLEAVELSLNPAEAPAPATLGTSAGDALLLAPLSSDLTTPEDDATGAVLSVSDDDLIEVKIDGVVVYRSLREAKQALSGEGGIENRLKAAAEAKNAYQADHTRLLAEFDAASTGMIGLLGDLETVLYTPLVAMPADSLRSDPAAYIEALDAYTADANRVSNGRAAVQKLVTDHAAGMLALRDRYTREQAALVVQALPVLKDPVKGKARLAMIGRVAIEIYGYSPAEISAAQDHRMYRMMNDLAQVHAARLAAKTSAAASLVEAVEQRTVRRLSAGPAARATAAKAAAAATTEATTRARTRGGKVSDIAATLITQRK